MHHVIDQPIKPTINHSPTIFSNHSLTIQPSTSTSDNHQPMVVKDSQPHTNRPPAFANSPRWARSPKASFATPGGTEVTRKPWWNASWDCCHGPQRLVGGNHGWNGILVVVLVLSHGDSCWVNSETGGTMEDFCRVNGWNNGGYTQLNINVDGIMLAEWLDSNGDSPTGPTVNHSPHLIKTKVQWWNERPFWRRCCCDV